MICVHVGYLSIWYDITMTFKIIACKNKEEIFGVNMILIKGLTFSFIAFEFLTFTLMKIQNLNYKISKSIFLIFRKFKLNAKKAITLSKLWFGETFRG